MLEQRSLLHRAASRADWWWLKLQYWRRGASGFGPSNNPAPAKRQLEFLKSQGLKPHHVLLDVGCGPLRAGVRYIEYLDAGNYYGIEKEPTLVRAGLEVEVPRHKLQDKSPHVSAVDNFDVSGIGVHFDYMIAYSVFNHLTEPYIDMAVKNLVPWLKPDGAFYADFREADTHRWEVVHPNRRDEVKRAYYPFSFFEGLAKKYGCNVEIAGEWTTKPIRKILRFTR